MVGLETSIGTKIEAKCIVIAAGAGSFVQESLLLKILKTLKVNQFFMQLEINQYLKEKIS